MAPQWQIFIKKILPQFHLPPFNPLSLPLSISLSAPPPSATGATRADADAAGAGGGSRPGATAAREAGAGCDRGRCRQRQSAWRFGGEGGSAGCGRDQSGRRPSGWRGGRREGCCRGRCATAACAGDGHRGGTAMDAREVDAGAAAAGGVRLGVAGRSYGRGHQIELHRHRIELRHLQSSSAAAGSSFAADLPFPFLTLVPPRQQGPHRRGGPRRPVAVEPAAAGGADAEATPVRTHSRRTPGPRPPSRASTLNAVAYAWRRPACAAARGPCGGDRRVRRGGDRCVAAATGRGRER